MKQYFAVGMYTEPILFGTGELFQGKGTGIAICEFDNGEVRIRKEIKLKNPSFFCMDEDRKKIYAVNELKEFEGVYGGGVTQISYDESGNMAVEKVYGTYGTDPCHIAAAPNGKLLAVSNFADGSVTVFSLDAAGNLVAPGKHIRHSGHSVNPVRQNGPHAHSIVFDSSGTYMMVPDLGLDQVLIYRCFENTVEEDAAKRFSVPGGNGPRFGVFDQSGQHFYLIQELSSQVMHCRYDSGTLTECEMADTLPEAEIADNICADLHLTPEETFLYASNRGHDSLAGYRVGKDGKLEWVGCWESGGKTPRNFVIDPSGKYLLAANQDSDNITVFRIEEDGQLVRQNQFYFGSPVCIRFFETTVFK